MVSKLTTRSFAFVLSEIDWISSHMRLPRNVQGAAVAIYRRAATRRVGWSTKSVVAAALYMACRECKMPRTLNEIAVASKVSRKEVARISRFIARELRIRPPPISPIDLIPRFASKLKLSDEAQSKAIELLQRVKNKGLTLGRDPVGVAAAAIYIAGVWYERYGDRRLQREVAEVALITEVTLRNSYKKLCKKLGLDLWGSRTAPMPKWLVKVSNELIRK